MFDQGLIIKGQFVILEGQLNFREKLGVIKESETHSSINPVFVLQLNNLCKEQR